MRNRRCDTLNVALAGSLGLIAACGSSPAKPDGGSGGSGGRDAGDGDLPSDVQPDAGGDDGNRGVPEPWNRVRPCAVMGWGPISSVSFAPDGLSVAMAGLSVKVFNVATGAVEKTYAGLTGDVVGVAYSPDGATIAAASWSSSRPNDLHARVAVWRVDDGAIVWTRPFLSVVDGINTGVAFSPDGSSLAVASDRAVTLVRPTTGETIATYAEHQNIVTGLAFSPNGSLVASTEGSQAIRIWRPGDLTTVMVLSGLETPDRTLAFSPDGTQLLFGGGKRFRVSDWMPIQEGLAGGPVAFAPDGMTFVSGNSIYSASTGAVLRQWPLGQLGLAVAYTPDSRNVLMAPSHGVMVPFLWSVADGSTGTQFLGEPVPGTFPALSPDGSRMVVGDKMFRLSDGSLIERYRSVAGFSAVANAFSPDGSMVAEGTLTGDINLLRADDGAPMGQVMAGHAGRVLAVAFSPTGDRLATAGGDKLVKLWTLPGPGPDRTLAGHMSSADALVWSPDGTLLASSETASGTVMIWRASDGSLLHTLMTAGHVTEFSPDGGSIQVVGRGQFEIFDVATGQRVSAQRIPEGDDRTRGGLAPVAGLLAVGGDWGPIIVSLPAGEELVTLPDPLGTLQWAAFTPNGLVAKSSDLSAPDKVVRWCY